MTTVKSRLLRLLEQNKGTILSGERLAGELNCSRTAVWKAVKALRAEGYQIEAGTNKGYCLASGTDLLSEEGIRVHLRKQDVSIKIYGEVNSTNRAAKQAAIAGEAGHGSFVLALKQTEGRGRRGRSFFSPEGAGLYLSVILQPVGTLGESLLITAAAATAVYRAVKKVCGIELDIKWVNDLYLRGKKVCGILTEAITDFEGGSIEYAIVGIGLNLYRAEAGLPKELEPIVGALYDTLPQGEGIERNRLAAEIVNELLTETECLKLSREYVERNIVPGHEIWIDDGECRRKAWALSVEPDGRLRVREEDGREDVLAYGEVSVMVNGACEA